MAVRTRQAGVKVKREVGVQSAYPSTGATRGRKTLPRDDESAARRIRATSKMKLGPAGEKDLRDYQRELPATTVNGRKKAPSEMHVKKRGGPFKRRRLHGG
ncbi:MAG: hypothetical protein IRZ16_24125 [Myxococcaceae bacterium]|nr:hypothetical protein [Myxococcaceae bacterium]